MLIFCCCLFVECLFIYFVFIYLSICLSVVVFVYIYN